MYLKNTGATAVTISDATLAGYSLKTIIKMPTGSSNPDLQSSIYFYWDNPPRDIIDAGEPIWYRFDPPAIPAGGVGQVAVRLRYVPTNWVNLGVVSSAGAVTTNITVDAGVPRLTSIGYSEDLRKVYLHWRRSGGAAPASVWLDGTNVTALTTTVGDSNVNFAASVLSLPAALPFFSYHVFQGVYADGKIASASQRAWTNKFIYASFGTFVADASYTVADWVDEAADHGFNSVQYNLGEISGYVGTGPGRADMVAHGYGYTILDPGNLTPLDPDMWFLIDEPDADEDRESGDLCGTGYKIPCDSSHWAGTLALKEIAHGQDLRALRPNVPTVVNLDGSLEPESFYIWGPAVDILQSDNYYEVRLRDSYWFYPNRIPLFNKPKVSYAVARIASAGAEPNPFNHLLYSVKWKCANSNNCGIHYNEIWPFPTPASKRMEAYYSLAGGSKGMGYWWFKGGSPSYGLVRTTECAPLWRELGLLGNEIKTARPLLVTSTPVDLPLTPGTNVWVRALACGTDTVILLVVNDNYYNDQAGCHYTAVGSATVTATLPSWLQAAPTAFEITAGGLSDVSAVLNGSQLRLNLGTLTLTKMIVVTADPTLRPTIQARYDSQVKPHVCNFAPELCTNSPPGITQQPVNQVVAPGGTANFTLVVSGASPLSYQWQKNTVKLGNGGHYSGCTTGTLTIGNVDSNDVASYRCVVTNAAGGATSSPAMLTLATNVFASVTLISIPVLSGDTTNAARAITPDGRWVVGASGSRGFLHAVNTPNVFNVVSSDGAQSTLLTGVGCRTNSGQRQIVMSGLSGNWFGAWMTADGGATWGLLAGTNTGKKPTVPVANGLAGTASDVFYSVWTDEGAGGTDNWGLNVGRFSNSWPATVAWGPKSVPKPDTTQVNGVSGNGRAVGWRRNGTTLVYANYVADWQGVATPAIWNFNGLDGTTAGQAFSVSADGTVIFGISPKSVAAGSTNYGYKAVFNATFPGAATRLSIAQLPNFPDTAGSTSLAIPYGCTADGKYAVGMSYRGIEKAMLWDTSNPDPAKWTVVDLTDVAGANGALNGFARLSRAYSVGTNAAGALVIAGAGLDTSTPANPRAFLMTVSPPIAPIGFPPIVTAFGPSADRFTCSFLSLANPGIMYYLDCTTNLAPPWAWTPISSTPGIGGMTSLSDPNPPGQQRYYRIRIQ